MADPTDTQNGSSISERAEAGEQIEMLETGVVDGDQLSRKTIDAALGRARDNTELIVAMSGAEVPLRDGLLHPQRLVRLAVTCEPIGTRDKYRLEKSDDGGLKRKLLGVKTVCEVRPVHVELLGPDAAAACEKMFEEQIAMDAQTAAKLLDRLNARMTEYMRSGEVRA